MGRRYAFELFYPVERVANALTAFNPYAPVRYRKRRGALVSVFGPAGAPDLTGLTPDTPLFWDRSLLFPADAAVRRFVGFAHPNYDDRWMEWDDEGNEYLPVGSISVTVRVGAEFAVLTFAACTSSMSDLFEQSRPIWYQFYHALQVAGGLVALFDRGTEIGSLRRPVLPDGRLSDPFDYRDFILEERDRYWHLDVDRYAKTALRATGCGG